MATENETVEVQETTPETVVETPASEEIVETGETAAESEEAVEHAKEEKPAEDDPYAFLAADLTPKGEEKKEAAPVNTYEVDRARQEVEAAKAELSTLRAQLAAAEGAPLPDMELINPDSEKYNPDAYNKQMFAYQNSQAQKMQAQQRVELEQRAAAEKFVAERDALLLKEMPFLFQGEKGQQAAKAIVEEAVRNGLPREETWALTAPMIKTFYNSLQWQAAKASRAKLEEKVSQKESPRPLKAEPGRSDKAGAALELLSKTGSPEDAVKALLAAQR